MDVKRNDQAESSYVKMKHDMEERECFTPVFKAR